MSNQRYRNSNLDGCSQFVTASVADFAPLLASDAGWQTVLRARSSRANYHGGEPVLDVARALGFDEAVVPAASAVAAVIRVGGGLDA